MLHAPAGQSLLVALLLLLAGCGGHRRSESLVKVSGQVVSEGKPFKAKPEERLTVSFCLLDSENKPTEKSYLAQVDRKGHFTASVLPGKHRVVLRLKRGTRDNFHGAYGPLTSPFVYDVHKGDSFTLDIKMPKKEVKQPNKGSRRR